MSCFPLSIFLIWSLVLPAVFGDPRLFSRHLCQSPTPNPLTDCPADTLLVSREPIFASSNQPVLFSTITAAVRSLANATEPSTILILPGTYHEQLNITTSCPLTILGQTSSAN